MATTPVKPAPSVVPSEALEETFRRLAGEWHSAVGHHSSTTIRNNHPKYREIIALGPDVVPLLLRDMEANFTHWFTALQEITGANPLAGAGIGGNIPKMVDAWLQWAKDNGYQW